MKVIPDFKATTIIPFLTQNVTPGSTIYTDGLKSFAGVSEAGFKHVARIQPLRSELRKGAKSAVPLADRAISNLQQWLIGTYHGVSKAQLQVYLDEFVFRHKSSQDTCGRISVAAWSRNRPQINQIRTDQGRQGSQPQPVGAC
jgi:transposase-like protein